MRWHFIAPIALLAMIGGAAQAEVFDGTGNLLCATVDATECQYGTECLERDSISISIPRFVRLNAGEGRLVEVLPEGTGRTTNILNTVTLEDRVIFQGVEEGRAWSMVLSRASGDMTLSAADNAITFTVFGACTPD